MSRGFGGQTAATYHAMILLLASNADAYRFHMGDDNDGMCHFSGRTVVLVVLEAAALMP